MRNELIRQFPSFENTICPEIQERIARSDTLLVDIDGCLYPGSSEVNTILTSLADSMRIVPCTTRSVGEMAENNYPGKNVIFESGFIGIFEAGLVVRKEDGKTEVLTSEESLRQIDSIRQLLKKNIAWIGRRNPDNKYDLLEDATCKNPWGFLITPSRSMYYPIEKAVPISIPVFSPQISLVIWPSGSYKECPPELNYYQVVDFLAGVFTGNKSYEHNLTIRVGSESVLVQPIGPEGEPITKLLGLLRLEDEGAINPQKTIFIGDDDFLDLPVALRIKQAGGIVIAPQNAGKDMRQFADLVTSGFAGQGLIPILQEVDRIVRKKRKDQYTQEDTYPRVLVGGNLGTQLKENGYITSSNQSNPVASIEKGRQRLNEFTQNRFDFAWAINVPEIISFGQEKEVLRPMIFINELNYGVDTDQLTDIPELIVFDDEDLIRYLTNKVNLTQLSSDPKALWVFPGGGGKYMKDLLRKNSIDPVSSIWIEAKRRLGNNGVARCDVGLPLGDIDLDQRFHDTETMVFVDDTICTGSTIEAIMNEIYGFYDWQPKQAIIIVEALSIPRRREMFMSVLSKFSDTEWSMFSALFYGGERSRPRLLTTGSIVRGMEEPERFSAKNYPPELIEKITSQAVSKSVNV